jgi:hypothetical protein
MVSICLYEERHVDGVVEVFSETGRSCAQCSNTVQTHRRSKDSRLLEKMPSGCSILARQTAVLLSRSDYPSSMPRRGFLF